MINGTRNNWYLMLRTWTRRESKRFPMTCGWTLRFIAAIPVCLCLQLLISSTFTPSAIPGSQTETIILKNAKPKIYLHHFEMAQAESPDFLKTCDHYLRGCGGLLKDHGQLAWEYARTSRPAGHEDPINKVLNRLFRNSVYYKEAMLLMIKKLEVVMGSGQAVGFAQSKPHLRKRANARADSLALKDHSIFSRKSELGVKQ